MEVTDLHVLAKMASGTPNEEDAFTIRDKDDNEISRIHNLRELVDALSNLSIEELYPSICRVSDGETECDIALWIHYVLGDATLSAKIFHLVEEYKDKPEKLKLEIFNLCFNRYLNFQELMDFTDEITMFENDEKPSDI
ncbi:MAG: hypothetical protein FK733_03520 [Asgard group archaeon]|nr:hypothetical protein [Asgard group archaeon]